MAETIRGINVVIGSDTTGLSKALSDVNKNAKDIQSELKQVERLLKLDPSNTELVAQKQKLLSEAIANSSEKLNRLRTAQEQVNEQFAKGEINEGQYRAFQREIAKTEQELKNLKAQADSTGKSLAEIGKSLQDAGQKMSEMGKNLSLKLTSPLIAAGGAAVKMGMDFNGAMANVATLIPGNTERVNELKKSVQDMAIEVGKGTSDLADGLYQAISAFGDTSDTAKVLEINAKAAAAGLATTTDAINLTSAVTKGYGDASAEAVQRVSDLAFQTVKLGQTTFPELAASIGRVTPLAASLGVSMEEMFGVMATGTGVTGTASEVSTQLRGVLQSLMAPTKDMTVLLKDMGFQSGDAMLKQLGLQGTINAIVNAAEASGQPLQKYIGSIEGQTLALALAGPQAATFTEKLKAMGNATGLTDEAFKEQTEGVNKAGFAWQQFTQQMAVTAQRLGDSLAPALTQLMDAMKPLVQWLTNLSPEGQKTILVVAGIAAAIGPLMAVLGPIITVIGSVVGALGALNAAMAGGATGIGILTTAFPALGTAITVITGPIGIAVAAIAALVAGGVLLYKNWDTIKEKVSEVWESVKTTISNAANAVVEFLKQWGPLILVAITGPIGLLVYAVATHWDQIKQFTLQVWEAIKNFVVNAFQWMYDHNYYFQGLVDFINNAWNTISTFTTEIWNSIKTALTGVWDAIAGAVTDRWQAIQNITTSVWSAISGWLSDVWERIKAQVSVSWGAVYSTISGIMDKIKNTFDNLVQSAYNWGKNLLQEFIDGIKSKIAALGDIVRNAASKVSGFLGFHSPTKEGPGRDADKWAPNLVNMFAEGIRENLPKLQLSLNEFAAALSPAALAPLASSGGSGGTVVVNVTGNNIQSPADEDRLADKISRQVAGKLGLSAGGVF
jgi:TP901 family phage tail tape measure protein